MGVYVVNCGTCGQPFSWFSGNLDQRCSQCSTNEALNETLEKIELLTPKPREVVVYLDGTDWRYEVGEASDGNKIFPGIKSLQEESPCWKGCGIVRCRLVFEEWVVEENMKEMFEDSSKTYSLEELETDMDVVRLESATKRLEWLEKQVARQKNKVIQLKVNLKNKGK